MVAQVMLPLLRLVVGLVGALAGSVRVRSQGADFADQHAPALQRVMDDASGLGARSAPRTPTASCCCVVSPLSCVPFSLYDSLYQPT